MKKISIIICIAFILSACATYKRLDLNNVTFGMTTEQVIQVAGKPNRVLSARQTEDGYQEVLEYHTSYGEVYALEFWDNYLTGFEYLHDEVVYVAPMHPPVHYPPYGRPVYIINNRPPQRPNRPNRPNRPSQPSRPSTPSRPSPGRPERPTESNRPSQPNRPESGGSLQTERPTGSNRPGQSTSRPENSRPSQSQTPDRGTLTRPAETPTRSSGSNTENSRSQ